MSNKTKQVLHMLRFVPFAFVTILFFTALHPQAVVQDVDQYGEVGRGDLVVTSGEKKGISEAWDVFFVQWKGFIAFMAGVGALTCVLTFIMLMVRLGKSADNPHERSRVFRDLMICLILAALLGGSSLVLSLLVEVVSLPGM